MDIKPITPVLNIKSITPVLEIKEYSKSAGVITTSEGATSPGTMADDATVGTSAWTWPNEAKVEDAVDVTTGNLTPIGTITHYLKATNFGFAIPTGATINGILVEIKKLAQFGIIKDNEVKIVKSDGSIGTTNKADTATAWPGALAYASHGASNDLWGETWLYSDINDVDFGVVLSAKSYSLVGGFAYPEVDHIRITVYYTKDYYSFRPEMDIKRTAIYR